jgi:hypothetical protein
MSIPVAPRPSTPRKRDADRGKGPTQLADRERHPHRVVHGAARTDLVRYRLQLLEQLERRSRYLATRA